MTRLSKRILVLALGLFAMSHASAMSSGTPITFSKLMSSGTYSVGVSGSPIPTDPSCEADIDNAVKAASTEYLAAYTPPDPVKTFNDSIADCLSNIKSFQLVLPVASILSFDFSALMDKLMDELMNKVMGTLCKAATDTWNNAVNNAVQTVQTGINTSGLNQVGQAVNTMNGVTSGGTSSLSTIQSLIKK